MKYDGPLERYQLWEHFNCTCDSDPLGRCVVHKPTNSFRHHSRNVSEAEQKGEPEETPFDQKGEA